jgi:hypothetical protein
MKIPLYSGEKIWYLFLKMGKKTTHGTKFEKPFLQSLNI